MKNVLFIMADQLRWDYLGCYGHPHLRTPNIDALAAKGVRFSNAFVQGSVCGASRMSTYTGRYVTSHGAVWNFVPLALGTKTLGDHVRGHGIRCAVVGKTHVEPDHLGAARLGLSAWTPEVQLALQGGFEPFERDDGLMPPGFAVGDNRYCEYLRSQGYISPNPWHDFANSSLGADGELHSGWRMRWAREPARVAPEHSETPYMTRRAIEFMQAQGDRPWVLHLSYIKPHWPYVAPAPYHAMYGSDQVVPVQRSEIERASPHPVLRGFMDYGPSQSFSRDPVRETVIPTYMGLISQIDEQIGELMRYLRQSGRDRDTLIVFTSDHGDYLGDHWLGEKELFHDTVVKVPLIVLDPSAQADATRGTQCREMVEAIDLLPTFLEWLDLPRPGEWLEGESLLGLLHGQPNAKGKSHVVCENSFGFRDCVRQPLGLAADQCHMTMLRTSRWKYVHFANLRPMLFDLREDPLEYRDLGDAPACAKVRDELRGLLLDWLYARRRVTTITVPDIEQWNGREAKAGLDIGVW